jgi:hypothetical protein
MTIHHKTGLAWETLSNVYVRDGGTWKEANEVWIKDAGVWKLAHSKAGSTTFTSNTTFTVPAYGVLTIEMWGGGAAGGNANNYDGSNGNPGGDTVVTVSGTDLMRAYGGNGGYGTTGYRVSMGGVGGRAGVGATAAFENTVISGNPGGGSSFGSGPGGAAPYGGAGGNAVSIPPFGILYGGAGQEPGGGGAGGIYDNGSGYWNKGGGASSGGYVKSKFNAGAIAVGTVLTIIIGAGGTSSVNGGYGAKGRIIITWTPK